MKTKTRPEWLDHFFKEEKINTYVSLLHNEKIIIIQNNKCGKAEVLLKAQTFKKIAKKLGYVKGE